MTVSMNLIILIYASKSAREQTYSQAGNSEIDQDNNLLSLITGQIVAVATIISLVGVSLRLN